MCETITYENKMKGRTNPPTMEPSLIFEIDKLNSEPVDYIDDNDIAVDDSIENKLD